MKKKLLLFILLLTFPITVFALEGPKLYSKKALIYDLTDNKVLYELEGSNKTSIASLTKIMTTLVAIENIDDLDKSITITNEMLAGIPYYASVAGPKVNDTVTYRDLLYASMLPSGADAMQCLAVLLAGDVPKFVEKMNAKAEELNMVNTNFVNITGLDANNHYSTLEDVLIMLKSALQDQLFYEIYTTSEYKLANGLVVKSTINMYNKNMNLDTSRILGSKTGNTDAAGLCMSAYFKSKDHEFLLITTNAQYVYGNFYNLRDTLTIIDYVDNNYDNVPIVKKNTLIKKLDVKNSTTDFYVAFLKHDIMKYLPSDYDVNLIKVEYEGVSEINFLTKKGTKLGEAKYYYGDELLLTEDVYLDTELKMDINKILYNYRKVIWIVCGGILIICAILLRRKKRS